MMKKIGIFYGSDSGNTEIVAGKIQEEFGKSIADIFDVSKVDEDDINNYEILIFGASTQGFGDLQYDFEEFLEKIEEKDLSNKTIAIFGLGDAATYPDTFADSIGLIYEIIKKQNAKIIGFVEKNGYEFDESAGFIEGKFVGLPIDEDNESDLTDERVKNWVEQLKGEFK